MAVLVNGDMIDEPDETFLVKLSSASSNATISHAQGVGTITDDDRDGIFSCRASGLRVGASEPLLGIANAANVPCADDSSSTVRVTASAGITTATDTSQQRTDLTPDDQAVAPVAGDRGLGTSSIQSVQIALGPLVTISVRSALAQASATCPGAGGAPLLTGSGSLGTLAINGVLRVSLASARQDISLAIGVLRLNHTTTTSNSVTQRALWFQSSSPLFSDVIIGEAKAGFAGTSAHPGGHPCAS